MSAAGPELPPHLLAKRKRQVEEDVEDQGARPSGAKRSKSPEATEKRARVMGPAPPPAPLDQRPTTAHNDSEDESSSEDDDFGPSLPTGLSTAADNPATHNDEPTPSTQDLAMTKSRRDEWMMVPPKQDDLAARMDPSKLRARGFNTGKSARQPAGLDTDSTIWTETPEQKRKRLEDAVMGVKSSAEGTPSDARARQNKAEEEAAARKLREHAASTRGASLMDKHQQSNPAEKEDDPSKRAFDREKDIASVKIGNAQRKEMLNKAAGFSSKFSSGSFL